ncbi:MULTISPECIES: DNA polymerase III subunit gamma/tau [Desulfococcus]|jgi:DNA polymerase-3 subunit gamma/tau|uniref:DNA polymerase III subunit gamma/tau n=1 Tax=Desulfococcus multivorans DSM 2059 TaxID=1121405 RepID=S7U0S3_DESML|nr:DNA polymerase III subunit gamma/tau [Desulfococcus multivorans]AOY58335.1 DnaX: DNA polymerase III, subunit gamma/tau [Desulfococcus multivorans]AQV00667.1 DNA polymerase III, subunit gamma and tau [Desulfococcus multivorans]EPR42590.1 DNA polymerase III, subunits gamma and tau [Desulfococcus multivorans DSM 2059]MDX9817911.1 DNA polymerase III subunit gamma/tau [Desulfococcus multivorans]SKA18193.1 DNA polymerase-3 subunit gamma/tau [Desulfococcus multivorans DSM 2059]
MSYLVLARKYRPQTFEDVVEQEHVTRTLTNAIRADRVAHAILFSGPRGTGKTTIARILAKAMNCETGPSPVPCNACRSCREITGGNAVDVFEIDGASNNGVDHIRELRDNVKYMPAHSRYKIYIIDEVHMLSTPAFNALLKTLEEPPAHILFLFATTEPHKIPITILSRCQQHHLRRIPSENIARHMAALCKREGTTIPEESLSLIAGEAGGSMRDALSLLDQVMTCTEGEITHEGVLNLLGAADREVLFRITAALFSGNVADILEIIDDVYRHGRDIKAFFGAVMTHLRNLWIVKTVRNPNRLVDLPTVEIERMAALVRDVSETHISQIMDAFTREESAVKFSSQPRLALEMAFIRLFQIQPALPIGTLIERLDDLAGRIPAAPEYGLDRTNSAPPEVREPDSPILTPAPVSPPSKTTMSDTDPARSTATMEVQAPPSETRTNRPEECRLPDIPADTSYDPEESLDVTWRKLTALACGRSSALGSYLNRTALAHIGDETLDIIVHGNGFNLKQIHKRQEFLQEAVQSFFGRNFHLNFRLNDGGEESRQKKIDAVNTIRQEALNHPTVAAAVEIFDGKIVDVKIL